MDFDFCLVCSWDIKNQRQIVLLAEEIHNRGYQVAIITPTTIIGPDNNEIQEFVLPQYTDGSASFSSPSDVEERYEIPSLNHIVHTERHFYNLSRSQALKRGVEVANALHTIFSDHSFGYILQSRGPEIHRLLAYHILKYNGGTPIWIGFSPFKDSLSLTTSLHGTWDSYQTIPYAEIPKSDRIHTEKHIEQFRKEKRFYDHNHEFELSIPDRIKSKIKSIFNRDRPGKINSQLKQSSKFWFRRELNERLHSSVETSRHDCRGTNYVLFPLQYPIESRLTIYSPQFFRQGYLAEYFHRVLPSETELFIKPHPSHPGWPSPRQLYKYKNMERVTVLNPELSSHFAIEHSEGVVVTNNTVGFESIYYNKPVFITGNAFYSGVPASISLSRLDNAPEKLAENVSTEISEREVVSSVYSLRKASYEGNWNLIEIDNINTIVDSIQSFIRSEL